VLFIKVGWTVQAIGQRETNNAGRTTKSSVPTIINVQWWLESPPSLSQELINDN
jgi:hypothetical protein